MAKPDFVEQGGLSTAPGPLRCRGVSMYGFWARADGEKLARRMEETFAEPTDGAVAVKPWLPLVLITFVKIETIVSEPFAHRGVVDEDEAVIWLPSVTLQPRRLPLPWGVRRRVLWPRHVLSMAIPYLWLDNPISVASGREVYGYQKNWGSFQGFPKPSPWDTESRPPPLDPPDQIELKIFGIESEGEGSRARWTDLMRVRRVDREAEASLAEEPDAANPAELIRETRRRLVEAADERHPTPDRRGIWLPGRTSAPAWSGRSLTPQVAEVLAGLIPQSLIDRALASVSVNQIFLKQFRDAEDGLRAAYQEVVLAPAAEISSFGSWFLPRYRLEIDRVQSHDVGATLGLESQSLPLAFAARFNFTVQRGQTLWRRAVPGVR